MESFDHYDINLLVSILNTKLRDYFDSIELLCDDLDWSLEELMHYLSTNGFNYIKNLNQIKPK